MSHSNARERGSYNEGSPNCGAIDLSLISDIDNTLDASLVGSTGGFYRRNGPCLENPEFDIRDWFDIDGAGTEPIIPQVEGDRHTVARKHAPSPQTTTPANIIGRLDTAKNLISSNVKCEAAVLDHKRKHTAMDIPGYKCLDWRSPTTPASTEPSLKRPKNKKTKEQKAECKSVRESGACLRCYVQKSKCGANLPCPSCQVLFQKSENAYKSRVLRWTACVTSDLSDLNIFAYGVSLHDDVEEPLRSPKTLDHSAFGDTPTMLCHLAITSATTGGSESLFALFDSFYSQIMEYIHGTPRDDWFVIEDRNPLNVLVESNTILLGSALLQYKLAGYIGYLRKLRAICASVVFHALQKALERNSLASASFQRQTILTIHLGLLLEQTLETRGDNPATSSTPDDKKYNSMHAHLIQYLYYYLHRLSKHLYPNNRVIQGLFGVSPNDLQLDHTFWEHIAISTKIDSLKRPPKVRAYSNLGWEEPELFSKLWRQQP